MPTASKSLPSPQDLKEMLKQGNLRAFFQPIVSLADGNVMGYEILGRGVLGGREMPTMQLLSLAEDYGLELELSAAFRDKGVDEAVQLPDASTLSSSHTLQS